MTYAAALSVRGTSPFSFGMSVESIKKFSYSSTAIWTTENTSLFSSLLFCFLLGVSIGFLGGLLCCGVVKLVFTFLGNGNGNEEAFSSKRPLDNLHHLDQRVLQRSKSLEEQESSSTLGEVMEDNSESSSDAGIRTLILCI